VTLRPSLLCALALILNSATGVLVVAMPLLAIRFGASPLQLGVLGSLGALVYTLACPLAGQHSDVIAAGGSSPWAGRRRSIMLCCSLLIAVDLCIFVVARIRDIFIMHVCGSLCAALFWPPLQAWFAETGPRSKLAGRLGIFNLSWGMGIMLGPAIGGYLYSLDYRYPWFYGVASSSAILMLLTTARTEDRRDEPCTADETVLEPPRAASFLAMALWANFACWFSLSNVQSIYPKLAVAQGFSPQLIGYLLFLVGATQSVLFIVLRVYPFWHYRYLPLVLAHGSAAAGMGIIFGSGSVPLLSLAFPLLGMGLGLSYYSSIYYSVCGHASIGRRAGIHEFMVGSGFLLGPMVGGVLAQYAGLRTPFLFCSAILAATAVREVVLGVRAEDSGRSG
jgi:MFS family permease